MEALQNIYNFYFCLRKFIGGLCSEATLPGEKNTEKYFKFCYQQEAPGKERQSL